ncbi:hypothetical protein QUF84_27240 [Fictibacillus enclensis]|uniref:hypothetical protein n=1 Tax=Fictibacillus enclensis TaxID=1017270 RepID=UPI0025A1E862|nr:hypothetical protein [Fictibacillus enclensis]MDM5340891.1 hypothetical protein [Fictibacillus enclensis]
MKRVIMLAAAFCFGIGIFAGALAAHAQGTNSKQPHHMHRDHMWKQLAPYKDKLHEKNQLKAEYYGLKKEALLKKDTLLQLHSGNQPGSWHKNPKMKQYHQSMRKLHMEMKSLKDKEKAEKKNLKAALKAKDKAKIGSHLDQMLLIQKQINHKLAERNKMLDTMIKEMKK